MRKMIIAIILLWSVVAQAADVTLAWDASPDPVTGYIIFYGEKSVLTNPSTVKPVGSVLQSVIVGLVSGRTYYFAIKAYYYNNESGFSNELVYTIPSSGNIPAVPWGLVFTKV